MPTTNEQNLNVGMIDERKITRSTKTNIGSFFNTTNGTILKVSRDADLNKRVAQLISDLADEHLKNDLDVHAIVTICVSDPVSDHTGHVVVIVPNQFWDDITEAMSKK